jgi:hypothetical protein
MHRHMPYVICDTTGEPVAPEQAKKIIAENWEVTADVRARRRSRKAPKGTAPQQVLMGHHRSSARGADKRGDLPHPRSSAGSANASSTRPRHRPNGNQAEQRQRPPS